MRSQKTDYQKQIKTIVTDPSLFGFARQRELVENIVQDAPFLPKAIDLEDIDRTFKEYVEKQLEVVSQGEKVPVYFYGYQRFYEFIKNWKDTNSEKVPKLPFIIITRDTMVERGTNLNGVTYSIPAKERYSLFRVPKVVNGKQTSELYQIPQPINVDVKYKVMLYANHQRDMNKFNQIMLFNYESSQGYLNVLGHDMVSVLDGQSDTSQLSDLEKRRFYRHQYDITVKGYIFNEKEFRIMPVLERINIETRPSLVKKSSLCSFEVLRRECEFCVNFKFGRKAPNSNSMVLPLDVEFKYDNQRAGNVVYAINGSAVTFPFVARRGDTLNVTHSVTSKKELNIRLCGDYL